MAIVHGSCRQWNLDVTVHSPLAASLHDAAHRPSAASSDGERQKHVQYGAGVCPISFERYGRLGPESREWLSMLASEASVHMAVSNDCALKVQTWRRRLEQTLAFEVADAALVSLGRASLGLNWQNIGNRR